jgi:hypothetical protein
MALSDNLARLSVRAKQAEDRVAAAEAKTKDAVKADVGAAQASVEAQTAQLREHANADEDKLSAFWKAVQQTWSKRSDHVRDHFDEMKADVDRDRAVRRATDAYEDAIFAIDFAYSAISEAEYAVLEARLAQMQVDELTEPATTA